MIDELRTVVRQVVAERQGEELWKAAVELGWLGLDVDEAHGGSGMGFDVVAPVLEELGRGLAPIPYLSTILVTSVLRDEWLEAVVTGERRVAVALDGVALDAEGADAVVVIEGDDAHLVTDPVVFPLPTYDESRHLARIEGEPVRSFPAGAVRDRAAVAVALDSVGGARRAMEVTVEYAKARQQFGQPIGAFQAVKHHCANMLVAVETATVAARAAVARLGDGSVWPSIAKSVACDAYVEVAGLGITVHGGIGFTWEHDMHRFLKRARLNQALFGTSADHRDRIAS